MNEIKMLDVVAVTEDLPAEGLRRGEVGTVVEQWKDGVFEVEFSGDSGQPYAFVALSANQLMNLHFRKDEVVKSSQLNQAARRLLGEGIELMNRGDEIRSEKKFREAINLDQNSKGALLNYLLKSFETGVDWDVKIQSLRFLFHLAPDYEEARNNLAITYLNYGVEKAKAGDVELAQILFNYAMAIDVAPNVSSKIRENFAGVFTALGAKEHAKRNYENTVGFMRMACMVFPNDKTRHNLGLAHANLALWYMENREHEKAIPVFESAAETGVILPELLNDYAIALIFEKRLDEARLAFERALDLAPESNLIKENLAKLSKKEPSESFVPDEITAGYIHIPTAAQQYQLAA